MTQASNASTLSYPNVGLETNGLLDDIPSETPEDIAHPPNTEHKTGVSVLQTTEESNFNDSQGTTVLSICLLLAP